MRPTHRHGLHDDVARWVCCAMFALLWSAISLAEEGDGYEPELITMVVGVPGGSGADVAARTLAKAWSDRIPGNPYIVVKNLEGAGGSAALNYVYEKAKPDGLTIYYGSWNPLDVIEGGAGIRFVPENFSIIGSGSSMRGTIVRTDIAPDFVGPRDLPAVDQIKVGGRSAGNVNDLIGNLALEILGVDYKFVAGYRGMSTIASAIYGREVQGGHIGSGGFARFFRETTENGETMIVYYHPFFDRDGKAVRPLGNLGDADSFLDVYEQAHGSQPMGEYWEAYKWLRFNAHGSSPAVLAPPGTPDVIVDVLRETIEATFADEEFQKLWMKQFDDVIQWNDIEDTLAAFRNYRNLSESMREVIREMSLVDWN